MFKHTLSKYSLAKWFIFVIATLLVAYCLPKEDENHYAYQVGRPWSYSLLTAPFDIPIHLDSVSARMVKDSIDRNFEPVFKRDVALEKAMVSNYATRIASARDLEITPSERNQLLNEIKRIYEDGIVDRVTYSEIVNHTMPTVRFIHDNVAISMPTGAFMSARSAYSRLDSVFPDQRFHQAIVATRLSEMLQPNVMLDSVESTRLRNEQYQKAMAPIGVIQQGERIIDRGDIVTEQLATILRTYEEISDDRGTGTVSQRFYPVAGQIMFILLAFGALYGFLFFFRPNYYHDTRSIMLMMLLIVVFSVVTFWVVTESQRGIFLIPYTIVPIMVLIFLDSRTALFTHIVMVLICAMVATFQLEFIFMQFVAGVMAINSIKELTRRSQLVRTALLVFISYTLSFVAVEVMQTGSVEKISTTVFTYLGLNAVLISFAYILIFIFEKLFGFTSRVTLVELSDINNPLLRELSEECPGTFQHSMSVSNLASAAAQRIGANVLLVRGGALYHDIGKIKNPAFYTENQHGVNPHDALDAKQSAKIVIGHVTEGLKLAEKAKLPAVLRHFITEHHGRGKAKYFYTTYCNAHPDEEVDEAAFIYPGPNPHSRETSILMMADAVEAASRSLTDHSPEAISELVNRIIDTQIAEGLHNDSPLSFRDVKAIKDTFAQRLRTLYHSRISYPDMKKNDKAE